MSIASISEMARDSRVLTCVQYAPFVEEFLIDRFGTDRLIYQSCVPAM